MKSLIAIIYYCILIAIPSNATNEKNLKDNHIQNINVAQNFNTRSIKRKKVSLYKELEKGPIIINFWATWCTPCIEEMQEFTQIESLLEKKQISVISISIDEASKKDQIKHLVKKYRFPFTFIHDPEQKIYRMYGAKSIPYSVIIIQDKTIIYEYSGFNETSKDAFKKILQSL